MDVWAIRSTLPLYLQKPKYLAGVGEALGDIIPRLDKCYRMSYQLCLYLLLSLLRSALPIQASLNEQLARSLNSVSLAANISYLVGLVVLVAFLLAHQFDHPDWLVLP
ncbi:MAG: DMT family transporter [Oculatellaceae cyanobacterium bins.114]|nr:DMT family transporter [Oculatellaceae cyanobacterium bins.114]